METIDINKVWLRCKAHDRKAQELLYNHFSKKMFAVCMRYAHTTLEAEDILQNSFVKIFTKHHLFEDRGSLEGWMKRIVINTSIETFRKNKANFTVSLEDSGESKWQSHFETDQLAYKDLLKMIQQLPAGYRTVFNLYAIEGYSHREIGEMLQISEGSSKSQLSRARQWLQEKLVKSTI